MQNLFDSYCDESESVRSRMDARRRMQKMEDGYIVESQVEHVTLPRESNYENELTPTAPNGLLEAIYKKLITLEENQKRLMDYIMPVGVESAPETSPDDLPGLDCQVATVTAPRALATLQWSGPSPLASSLLD